MAATAESPAAPARPGKLPAIPQSPPGEPPYFIGVYKRRSEASRAAKNEAASIGDQLAWAGSTVLRVNKYRNHYFRWSERLAAAREHVRVSTMSSPATWEAIQDVVREFDVATAAYAETCLAHVHRFFKGRAPLPKGYIPLDDDAHSFVIREAGILVHVWRSQSQAKLFVNGMKALTAVITDARMDSLAVPLTVLHSVAGCYVSCTALPPLVGVEPADLSEAPIMSHVVDELEVLCRTQQPLRLWSGADGRLHLLDPLPTAHLHGVPEVAPTSIHAVTSGESASFAAPDVAAVNLASGDLCLGVHPALLASHPDVAVTVPRALDEAAEANIAVVAQELQSFVLQRAGGNSANVRGVVKVLDLMEEALAPSVFHRHGVPLRFMFAVMSHASLRGNEAGAVVRELLLNEMAARTVKALVRADLDHTPSNPPERGTTAVAHAFVTDILNRCIFALLVRKEFWETQFLPILRAKYNCPEEFQFKQELVAKRTVVTFLRMHLGAIFEGGKFTKLTPVRRGHTAPIANARLTRFLNGQKAEVHEEILATWKSVTMGIQDTSLKMCSMLLDIIAAAATKATFIMKLTAQLSTVLEEVSDDSIAFVMRGITMEAVFELPEITAFFAALAKYRDTCLLPHGTDYPLDHLYVGQRYRLCGLLLLAADKQQRADAGTLFTNAARYFMVTTTMQDQLLPDPVFALYIDILKYNLVYDGAEPDEAFVLAERTFKILLKAVPCDLERRREKLCEAMRFVLARLMALPQDFPSAGRAVFAEIAVAMHDMYAAHIPNETDTRRQIMLLVTCSHVLSLHAKKITAGGEKEQLRSFRELTLKVDEALASDQKAMLRADWALPRYGPVALLLQRFTQWGLSKELLDMVHGFSTSSQFRTAASRKLQAATSKQQQQQQNSSGGKAEVTMMTIEDYRGFLEAKYGSAAAKNTPDLAVPTDHLVTALKAAHRLQWWHRENNRKREELARQRELEAEKTAKQAQARAERVSSRLPVKEILTASNVVNDLAAKKFAAPQVPPVLPYHAPRFSSGHGLIALVSVAKPKSCINLCAVLSQSELMPPIKWTTQPAGPGARALSVVPATSTFAHWFNQRWMAPVDWYVGDEHPSVAAKRAKQQRAKAAAASSPKDGGLDSHTGDGDDDDDDLALRGDEGKTPPPEEETKPAKGVSFAMSEADFDRATTADQPLRTTTMLFAKVFAVLIYSQNKYSFLKWNLSGQGWAAPVTELLATMLPNESVNALVTFGGIAALGDFVDEIPAVPHAHVFHRQDVSAYLPIHPWLANNEVVYDRMLSRLCGTGVVAPTLDELVALPSYDFLRGLAHFSHLGDHLHVLWSAEDQKGASAAGADADRGLTSGAESGADEPVAAPPADDGDAKDKKSDDDAPAAADDDETKDDAAAPGPAEAALAENDQADGPGSIVIPSFPKEAQQLVAVADKTRTQQQQQAVAAANENESEDGMPANRQPPPVLHFLVNVKSDLIRFLDLRQVLPWVPPHVYQAHIINTMATTRAMDWARDNADAVRNALVDGLDWSTFGFVRAHKLPLTPHSHRISRYLDPYGGTKPLLRSKLAEFEIELPATVEAIANTVEKLLLAYPKLGCAIVAKATFIPETYGGFPNFDFATRMERAASSESDLAAVLEAIKAASWDSPAVASQLFELSACGQPADDGPSSSNHQQHAASQQSPARTTKRSALRLATNVPTLNSLYVPLLENYVELHNLALTVPLKSKPDEPEPEPEEEPDANPDDGQPNTLDDDSSPADDQQAVGDAKPDHQRDTVAAALARPDGYHVGWCVAVASASRGVGKSTIVQKLVTADIKMRGVAKMHLSAAQADAAAASQPGDVPFVRLSWRTGGITQADLGRAGGRRGGGGDDAAVGDTGSVAGDDADGPADADQTTVASMDDLTTTDGHTMTAGAGVGDGAGDGNGAPELPPGHVVQMHFQEVRYDGKRASTMLMQCAAQVLWVVCDAYTLEQLQRSNALDKYSHLLNVIVLNPKFGKAPQEHIDAAKRFALSRSVPFAVVDDERSSNALLQSLTYWMLPSIRLPLSPMTLPPNVELGSLSSLDPKVVDAYLAVIAAQRQVSHMSAVSAANRGGGRPGGETGPGATLTRTAMLARKGAHTHQQVAGL